MRFNSFQNLLIIAWVLFTINSGETFAQETAILDGYIKQGLDNNLSLKQKELNLQKSLETLKEANGLFYPLVELGAQYTISKGGRSINLPIGDMLNPVYSTLNQMLEDAGRTGNFPQISNEKIQFLPNDYHDTKIRVVLPLVNAEIYYNRKIKKELITVADAEVNVYKRELIKEIKTAYLRYLQSIKIAEAYNSALGLVNEALRVNRKLVDNQMAGHEKLYRIEAEQSQVSAELAKARNDIQTAASYFNFLINQPLKTNIIIDSALININNAAAYNQPNTTTSREEILQLNSAIKSSDYFTKMKKSYLLPNISNITDLGYQGYSYTFNNEQQYAMNIINLSWPIFNGFQNRRKIARAQIETNILKVQLTEIEHQIELQQQIAFGNFETSVESEKANESSLNSSKEYYKVIGKQYENGQKSLLDLLDARNQLTKSQISYTVSFFDKLVRIAELERAYASYDLNSLTGKN